jgi:hypothetical protein
VALTLDLIRGAWPGIVAELGGRLGVCYGEARPVEVDGSRVVVAFAEGRAFPCRQAATSEYLTPLRAACRKLLGTAPDFSFEVRSQAEIDPEAARPLSGEELVSRLMAEFDAEEYVPPTQEPEA